MKIGVYVNHNHYLYKSDLFIRLDELRIEKLEKLGFI